MEELSREPEFSGDRSPQEVNDLVQEKIGFLLDNNAKITVILRDKANEFKKIAEIFMDQAATAIEVAEELAELALTTSVMTGDILMAEFGDGHTEESEGDE